VFANLDAQSVLPGFYFNEGSSEGREREEVRRGFWRGTGKLLLLY
jgi:hypothetical protein